MALSQSQFFTQRSQRNYSDVWHWPERPLSQRLGNDFNEWNDAFDTSLISSNRRSQLGRRSSAPEVTDEKNKFIVKLDVSHFKPEEISVKIVDNFIIISGKHEDVMDKYGWVSRQFTRKYALPEDCDTDKVISSLSTDGLLIIEAPKKALEQLADNERIIPITIF
jgi:HSP20 family molecular chaperone IbpA